MKRHLPLCNMHSIYALLKVFPLRSQRLNLNNTLLLTARPWAERGSCSARGFFFLTARPWAERGSCSARGFLTARPWAERGSCSARGFFFFVFVSPDADLRG